MIELIGVASYARTSEQRQGVGSRGVSDQHRINRRTCAEHGFVVVKEYTDGGRSASRPGVLRPGFERLLADLQRGDTDDGVVLRGVACVADDRLYRRVDDYARFVAAFTGQGGRIYVQQTGPRDLYTRAGFLDGAESVRFAVRETEVRSRRVTNWHWSRAVDGLPHSGPRPFGWAEDRMTLHPTESTLLRNAIIERINGRPVSQIASEWKRLGVTGTRGKAPNAQTVTQMMTAPRVCGYRANRGVIVRDPETGKPVLGGWATLVSAEQWEAVCRTFSPGSTYLHRGSGAPRLTNRTAGPRYLASGLIRCRNRIEDGKECGAKMGGRRQPKSRRSPHVYFCSGCGGCTISGPLVDDVIRSALLTDEYGRPLRLPDPVAHRWVSGRMGLMERREVIARFLSEIKIRPGVKGCGRWDRTRVVLTWRETAEMGGHTRPE